MKLDVANRVQAVTLRLLADKGYFETEEKTGIPKRTLQRIISRAKERGLDPDAPLPARWKDERFIDAPWHGRPSKREAVLGQLTQRVTLD